MIVPTQLLMDVNTQILGRSCLLKDMTMDIVVSLDDMLLVCHMQQLALFGMEFHLPVCFPLLQSNEVPLESGCISFAPNLSV